MTDTADVIKQTLTDLFTAAAGADRIVLTEEVRKAGIPRQWAESVSRMSKRILNEDDAKKTAETVARSIAAELAQVDTLDPEELAKSVPRL